MLLRRRICRLKLYLIDGREGWEGGVLYILDSRNASIALHVKSLVCSLIHAPAIYLFPQLHHTHPRHTHLRRNRNPPPRRHSQRHPPSNQTRPPQRRYRAKEFEALRVQHEQVDASAEHGHAGREEGFGPDVLGGRLVGDEEGDGVEELGVRAISVRPRLVDWTARR